MKHPSLGLIAVLTVFLAGCEHDCFDIEIRPDGAGFERRLTCWHVSVRDNQETLSPLSPQKLARIGELYSTRESPAEATKQVFSGRFGESTPADVGGAGRYTHFTSSLGSTSSYLERFRGDDDLESRLAIRRQAANQLAGLVAGWMEQEAGRDPQFPRLKQFLDRDLRRDLVNLGVYGWANAMNAGDSKDEDNEFLVRVGLYLGERGYFAPSDVPRLTESIIFGDGTTFFAHVQRLAARKMGVADDQPIPASLAFLGDPNRVKTSLEKYVRSTDLFRERIDRWKIVKKEHPDAEEPSPMRLLADLACRTVAGTDFQLNLGEPRDRLELTLFCGEKPFSTNGRWYETRSAVTWSKTLRPERTLPLVCFAQWSTPDRAFQERHFGTVLLTGTALAQYAIWRQTLKPQEAAEWERFLGGLSPGAKLKASVEGFRFSTDPKHDPDQSDKPPASLADTPRRLILEALKGHETSKQ